LHRSSGILGEKFSTNKQNQRLLKKTSAIQYTRRDKENSLRKGTNLPGVLTASE